jgi:hypothetical protein
VPDPEAIIAGFHAEFADLLAAVGTPRTVPTVARMSAALDGAGHAGRILAEGTHRHGETSPAWSAGSPAGCRHDQGRRSGKNCPLLAQATVAYTTQQ